MSVHGCSYAPPVVTDAEAIGGVSVDGLNFLNKITESNPAQDLSIERHIKINALFSQ